MANHVGAAVIGDLAGRVVSKVIDTLWKRPAVDEKLRRLKTLVMMLRSTVEVSEKLGVESKSLLEWRDRLKEAAFEGHRVLLSLQGPNTEADAAGLDAKENESSDVHKEDASDSEGYQVAPSSQQRATEPEAAGAEATEAKEGHCGSKSGAASFARKTLLDMARGVRSATSALLSGGEGAEKLSSTVDRLEKEWADVGEFIRLIQVEASRVKAERRPTKRRRSILHSLQKEEAERAEQEEEAMGGLGLLAAEGVPDWSLQIARPCIDGKAEEEAMWGLGLLAEEDGSAEEPATPAAVAKLENAWAAEDGMFEKAELAEEPAMATAVKRLEDALAEVTRAVEMAEGREFTGMACLAEWADILRDATQQGRAILAIFSDAKADKHEADQLCSAVDIMEDLVLDAHCFINLVSLCPSI